MRFRAVLVAISRTAENKEVSPAKVYMLNCKLFDKSLKYIEGNKDSKFDPCGALVLTFSHDKNLSFKSTLCCQFYKKLIKGRSDLFFVPFLKFICKSIVPELIKIFDMSRNTPLIFKSLLKQVKILRVINIRLFTQESLGLNPYCYGIFYKNLPQFCYHDCYHES